MTCALVRRRAGEAALGLHPSHAVLGRRARLRHVGRDWTVLAARRHLTSVADLSDDEAAELGVLVRDVSRAIQHVIKCDKTYVAQFAEHPQHPHVHVHVIPRTRHLPPEFRGPRIFDVSGVPGDECVTEDRMNEIARELRPLIS